MGRIVVALVFLTSAFSLGFETCVADQKYAEVYAEGTCFDGTKESQFISTTVRGESESKFLYELRKRGYQLRAVTKFSWKDFAPTITYYFDK